MIYVGFSLFYISFFFYLELTIASNFDKVRNLNIYLSILYYISYPLHNILAIKKNHLLMLLINAYTLSMMIFSMHISNTNQLFSGPKRGAHYACVCIMQPYWRQIVLVQPPTSRSRNDVTLLGALGSIYSIMFFSLLFQDSIDEASQEVENLSRYKKGYDDLYLGENIEFNCNISNRGYLPPC